MDVIATVKVKASAGSDAKPDRARVERAAELLRQSGFAIQHLGRFGVSIAASGDVFHRVLGVTPKQGEALTAPVRPAEPELHELLEHIEVVPKPRPM